MGIKVDLFHSRAKSIFWLTFCYLLPMMTHMRRQGFGGNLMLLANPVGLQSHRGIAASLLDLQSFPLFSRIRTFRNHGKSFLKISITILNLLAAAVSIVGFFYQFWPTSTDGKVGMVVIGILALCLWIHSVYLTVVTFRRVSYAEVVSILQGIHISCIERPSTNFEMRKDIETFLQEVCNSLASAFTMITHRKCAVCIKAVMEENFQLRSICRDPDSAKLRGKLEAKSSVVHKLENNTAFREIWDHLSKGSDEVFFDNNLPSRQSYSNSSFEIYGNPPDLRIPIFGVVWRYISWPLGYRSAIVAPICSADGSQSEAPGFIGILAVDCVAGHRFRRTYDKTIVRFVAMAVHSHVLRWIEFAQAGD